MDNDKPYLDYQHHLISIMRINLAKLTADESTQTEGLPEDLIAKLDYIYNTQIIDEGFYDNGQQIICRLISGFPQLTPQIPRPLLWFFGGDCLHYMPDEEIKLYQQLEEARILASQNKKQFDFAEAYQLLSQQFNQQRG